MELLLSYQLPWLQLGLEVVLGVEVHKARLATGRDGQLVRLSTLTTLKNLIAQRMLADPGISQRFGTTGTRLVQGRAREAMLQELRAHLLERFLCLVALLDHAKHLEVLPRRRPLFRPSAAVKSSADVLIEFAKALLAGEGNLAKHLASLGYRVRLAYNWAGHVNRSVRDCQAGSRPCFSNVHRWTNTQVGHKQTYLEEFDFRATQLSRDLRDGVRLARLVDTLEVRANGVEK